MHWIALLPLPHAEPPATSGPDEALRLWSWRALQFTPRVAVADGVVVLEIAASERLFGGRRALLRQFIEQNQPHPVVEWSGGAMEMGVPEAPDQPVSAHAAGGLNANAKYAAPARQTKAAA